MSKLENPTLPTGVVVKNKIDEDERVDWLMLREAIDVVCERTGVQPIGKLSLQVFDYLRWQKAQGRADGDLWKPGVLKQVNQIIDSEQRK